MKCPRCQHDNREGRHFCAECGATLTLACPACGFSNGPGEKFCGGCGAPLGAPPGTTTGSRFSSPESYTPKHLAERILTSKAALEGERKQVTVLFADLKGSMELLADRDPEEARKLLDPVLERMMEAVHRYEGTVNQVMGDGIMALFGAPLAHEDHAVRACYAALRMQESVKKYADEVRRSHAAVVKIRVGLNSGEVVVRAIGSDLHMDYTAVGQTTHLAARMEQLASPGNILLTPSTLDLVEGFVAVKPLGPVPVKGLANAVEVYEVTGAGPARTRLQGAARRGLTRFVGRDVELEQLRRAQQLAGNGHGQVAAVVGEAGVGKSRLVYEFTHSHRLQGWLVLEGASVSYGTATSYLPVVDLLKGYFKIQDRDDFREIREKLTGKLLTLDESLKPTLPALLALLDVPVDDAVWRTLDPAERRRRTLDSVRRLFLREAREQPLLLIFEDLHWIDGETQALLDGLVDSLGSARLLLLVSYRPEYQHPWGSKTYYGQMRLDALPAESAGELLDALLGDDAGLAALKQLLVKRGNPFFLEETVRTLVETKALAGERGRYRLTQPVQTIQVPPTVQAMLAARIDRLPPEDKRLLQVAAVVGKDVPFAVLAAISGLEDGELRRQLGHLQAAEFLYEANLFPDVQYTFKHALMHEVAYGGLLHQGRIVLHRKLAGVIEQMYAQRLEEHIDQLAHHALRGEMWMKAAVYLRQAGERAMWRSALREAVPRFEQASAALRQLPESRETLEQGLSLLFKLRNALFPLGEQERIIGHLREAERLAEALGDQRRLGRVFGYLTSHYFLMGQHARAIDSGRRAQSIADALSDVALRIETNTTVAHVRYTLGEIEEARSLLARTLDTLQTEVLPARLAVLFAVVVRLPLVLCLIDLGRFREASVRAEEAIQIADGIGHHFPVITACLASGFLHLGQGDARRAAVVLERALAACEAGDVRLYSPWVGATLGVARARTGAIADALPLLEEAVARATATKLMASHALVLGHLSEAYLLAGRVTDARRTAERAIDSARQQGERTNEASTLRLLGQIASCHDRPDAESAETYYRQGLDLATELGIRPLVAHCHLGLGKLYPRTGKHQEAQEHLTTATTMYREMDMRFWLEQAEAEMAEGQ